MILTITLNPSVDISYKLDQLFLDGINRVSDVSKTAGGKGLNVTRVIQQLNEDVAASGFLGGSLGNFIRTEISNHNIDDFFIEIRGETRNCIAMIHDDKQTEILESGPKINNMEAVRFLKNFQETVQTADVVTVSGSLPKGLDKDFYTQLIEIANKNNTPLLMDTNGTVLKDTLKSAYKPFLIKPNQEEIADLLGTPITDLSNLTSALLSPTFNEIPWVIVTLGAEGAVVMHNKKIYQVSTPGIDAINPVGSGDSVIAGFATGMSRGLRNEELIKYSLSMGVLNAMEAKTGSINPDKIEWCAAKIDVKELI